MNFKYQNRSTKFPITAILLMVITLLLTGCGPDEPDTFSVGIFNPFTLGSSEDGGNNIEDSFAKGLENAGFIEGENLTFVHAPGGAFSPDAQMAAVQVLVDANVDMIYCVTTPACQVAQSVTAENEIPVVFMAVSDPLAAGLVEDWAHPGGNITGISSAAIGIVNEGRRLEWLLAIAVGAEKVYIPYDPNNPVTLAKLVAVQDAASKLGVELILAEIPSPDQALAAFQNIPEDADAVMAFSEHSITAEIMDDIMQIVLKQHMPLSLLSEELGNLMFYSSNLAEMSGQAARLAGLILNGNNPSDLPVEAPEFFLTVNLQTAKAIGIEVPDTVLNAANTIIR